MELVQLHLWLYLLALSKRVRSMALLYRLCTEYPSVMKLVLEGQSWQMGHLGTKWEQIPCYTVGVHNLSGNKLITWTYNYQGWKIWHNVTLSGPRSFWNMQREQDYFFLASPFLFLSLSGKPAIWEFSSPGNRLIVVFIAGVWSTDAAYWSIAALILSLKSSRSNSPT